MLSALSEGAEALWSGRVGAVGRVGWRVEEPLAPPSADEAAGPEQAALGRDRLSPLTAEPEERDGRARGRDRVDGAGLAPEW